MLRLLGKTFLSVSLAGIVAISLYVAAFRLDDVTDWWVLRDYQPPQAVAQLAEDTTLTDLGERYFYVYDPQLLSRDTFRQRCTVAEESIVLGCYISRDGLYIFDVEDPQLAGVRQVTAAHEMLHVAYERLSTSERERIDRLNWDFFNELDNERVRQTVAAYEARDPGVVANELHSILPTEVRQLTPELEEYYGQYFDDRIAVVGYSEQYAQVFEEARQKVDRLDSQLQQQLSDIESLQAQLTRQARELEQQRDQLNQLLAQDNIAAYNSGISSFNQNVSRYNQEVERLGRRIDSYNSSVAERNAAALAHESLVDSIDSNPAAQFEESGGN